MRNVDIDQNVWYTGFKRKAGVTGENAGVY
jgi:hypothetical protein